MAIADQLTRLNELRQNLAAAISAKGVAATETEGFETLVQKVAEIEGTAQVQRYEGTFTTDSDGNATVNCGFQPDIVYIFNGWAPIDNRTDSMAMFFSEVFDSSKENVTVMWGKEMSISAVWKTWTSTGFSLWMLQQDINWAVSNLSNKTIKYVAIKYT